MQAGRQTAREVRAESRRRSAQAAEVKARTCNCVQTRLLLRRQRKYVCGESQHLQHFYSLCSSDSVKSCCFLVVPRRSFCPAETLWSPLNSGARCTEMVLFYSSFIQVKRRSQVLVCGEQMEYMSLNKFQRVHY